MKVGQILFTKDGRFTGNAIILAVLKTDYGNVFQCRTDFGNVINLTDKEIFANFHTSKGGIVFTCNPDEHLQDQIGKLTKEG